MRESIVLQLQAEAIRENASIAELLRTAKAVSVKLGNEEIKEWLSNEMDGYRCSLDDVPEYRQVRGELRCMNPYNGWIPLEVPPAFGFMKLRKVAQPAAELEALLKSDRPDHRLIMPFPDDAAEAIMKMIEERFRPGLEIPSTEIVGILDAIRNRILDWALALENSGVLGEGLSFTREEKMAARDVNYNITNIGSMANSAIQQQSPNSPVSVGQQIDWQGLGEFLARVRRSIDELGLDTEQRQELQADVATAESQTASPKPKTQIVGESLKSIRRVLETAAGKVVAVELLADLAKYLPHISGTVSP